MLLLDDSIQLSTNPTRVRRLWRIHPCALSQVDSVGGVQPGCDRLDAVESAGGLRAAGIEAAPLAGLLLSRGGLAVLPLLLLFFLLLRLLLFLLLQGTELLLLVDSLDPKQYDILNDDDDTIHSLPVKPGQPR